MCSYFKLLFILVRAKLAEYTKSLFGNADSINSNDFPIFIDQLANRVKGVLGLMIFLSFFYPVTYAQDCLPDFGSPIKHKVRLSGSFGEPRKGHFHSGIDYKQYRGIPRDTIFAVADGYVSRISIQSGGYGNALYIDHDCNMTSVYAHLWDYAPHIRTYINKILYDKKKYAISHHPLQDSLLIKKGQYIGIMGSTGRSSGPHLHFEIRQTDSETPINPALANFKPTDDIPPKIVGIMIYELSPDDQELSKSFRWAKSEADNSYTLHSQTIKTRSLKVGIGIRTYDQMNGASNHNGIYSLNLKVDGESIFSFKLDSIPFDQSKFIHAHMDYEEKVKNRYVTKCFLNTVNNLPIYSYNDSRGMIYPFDFKKTNVEIIVKDIEGNKSSITFDLQREENIIYDFVKDTNDFIKITSTDSLDIDLTHSILTFDRGTFCQPVRLALPQTSPSIINLKQDKEIPTFKYFKIAHRLHNRSFPMSKYSFTAINDKDEIERYRTKWENDSTLVTFVNKFAKYSISIDTLRPTIKTISLPGKTGKRFKIKLTDNYMPVYDSDKIVFDVYLDDQWILCQHDAKSNTIWFDMVERMKVEHEVKIVAIDASDNRIEVRRAFFY